jgi:hypothetical protein
MHHLTLGSRVLQAAKDRGIEIAFLPFRSPELNPCEDLWRGLKGEIAAKARMCMSQHMLHRVSMSSEKVVLSDQ